eukprot:4351966-Amphidinium_carterae.1
MPREESPARMRTRDRSPIPLAHMPRERQYDHPLGLTIMYAKAMARPAEYKPSSRTGWKAVSTDSCAIR